MTTIVLEQALFHRRDRQTPQLKARSPGFTDEWVDEADRMIVAFGDRPPGVACPLAVFARPLTAKTVAIVRVADQDLLVTDTTAGESVTAVQAHAPGSIAAEGSRLAVQPLSEDERRRRALNGVLGFHVLVVARADYERYLGDPFQLAEQLPPTWQVDTTLASLTLPCEPLPARTVAQVQQVLRRVKASALREDEDPEAPDFERTIENSESPALLGGVQVLVDGGKLVFTRHEGDLPLLAGLWLLLPVRTRGRIWPASFAFSNRLGFDAVAVPTYDRTDYPGYTTEEQAADYPQGSYELALQLAAEANDQHELDRVFQRRNSNEALRLAITLLIAVSLIVFGMRYFDPFADTRATQREQAAVAAGMVSVGDPWTALGLRLYGSTRWGAEANAASK